MSAPISISKTLKRLPNDEVLTIAAGCFWGTEHMYRKHFVNKLVDCKVGYANGTTSDPTYKAVCTGTTNHAEALQISYDPSVTSFKELIDFFFRMHDPTTINSQGPDVGTQYRSAIFTHSDEQSKIAKLSLEEVQKKWYPNNKIETIIEPIKSFYDAEEYHQKYLFANPSGYQCPSHFLRTAPK